MKYSQICKYKKVPTIPFFLGMEIPNLPARSSSKSEWNISQSQTPANGIMQGQVWMPAFPIMFTNTVATQGNMNMQGINNFITFLLKF